MADILVVTSARVSVNPGGYCDLNRLSSYKIGLITYLGALLVPPAKFGHPKSGIRAVAYDSTSLQGTKRRDRQEGSISLYPQGLFSQPLPYVLKSPLT
jgi:hypothetical protein